MTSPELHQSFHNSVLSHIPTNFRPMFESRTLDEQLVEVALNHVISSTSVRMSVDLEGWRPGDESCPKIAAKMLVAGWRRNNPDAKVITYPAD